MEWKVRSQRFCPLLLDKNRNYEGIWSNKRKLFVKSNFKNETLFVSFTAIITSRNGWNGTDFYVGNRAVGSIKMSRNRLVNIIVPYGTKVQYLANLSDKLRPASDSFNDIVIVIFHLLYIKYIIILATQYFCITTKVDLKNMNTKCTCTLWKNWKISSSSTS